MIIEYSWFERNLTPRRNFILSKIAEGGNFFFHENFVLKKNNFQIQKKTKKNKKT
jgi:hypothetical protein